MELARTVELDPETTVVSLDGFSMGAARTTLSAAKPSCASSAKVCQPCSPSSGPCTLVIPLNYLWWDAEGGLHEIPQAKPSNKGTRQRRACTRFGQHDSLVAASASLRPGERLAAFLDDLYVVTIRSGLCISWRSSPCAFTAGERHVRRPRAQQACRHRRLGLGQAAKSRHAAGEGRQGE